MLFPKGAEDTLQPFYNTSGQPTGAFIRPTGAPYSITGIPGTTVGTWQSVTVTWKDQTKWRFTPLGSVYVLTRISNRMDRYIDLVWDS